MSKTPISILETLQGLCTSVTTIAACIKVTTEKCVRRIFYKTVRDYRDNKASFAIIYQRSTRGQEHCYIQSSSDLSSFASYSFYLIPKLGN